MDRQLWVAGWVDGWMDEEMDKWMMDVVVSWMIRPWMVYRHNKKMLRSKGWNV